MFRGAEILESIRRERPLVHHITSFVTIGDCADITASIGALPVMAHALEEVQEMAASARAVVVNTGTLYPEQVEAMLKLGKSAAQRGIPAVLDPVGAGATSYRTDTACKLMDEARIPIIKGNGAEIGSLAGVKAAKISGVHSLEGGDGAQKSADMLLEALDYRAVIAVTGAVDVVTDGERVASIYNGHPLLPQVVGSGCMAASLVASFAAVEENYFDATVAALVAMGVAGEIAAGKSKKEGGKEARLGVAEFKVRLLDALFCLSPDELLENARVVYNRVYFSGGDIV